MLVFASFWDRFWKKCCVVLDSIFGAFEVVKNIAKMLSNIDADICIEKIRFRGSPALNSSGETGGQEGYPPWGPVNLPRGGAHRSFLHFSSLGIAFASLFDFLQIVAEFWVHRKIIKNH